MSIQIINLESSIPFIARLVTDLTQDFVGTLSFIFTEFMLFKVILWSFKGLLESLAEEYAEREEQNEQDNCNTEAVEE